MRVLVIVPIMVFQAFAHRHLVPKLIPNDMTPYAVTLPAKPVACLHHQGDESLAKFGRDNCLASDYEWDSLCLRKFPSDWMKA